MEKTGDPKVLIGQDAFAVLVRAEDLYNAARLEAAQWRQEVGTLAVAAYIGQSDTAVSRYRHAAQYIQMLEATAQALEPLYLARGSVRAGDDLRVEVTPVVKLLQAAIALSKLAGQDEATPLVIDRSLPEPVGGCPVCGNTDGVVVVGTTKWFYCDEHKTRWDGGDGLLGDEADSIDLESQKQTAFLSAYAEVEPIGPDDERDDH